MRSYVAAFALALVLCALLVPLVRRWAFQVGAVSHPGGRNVNQHAVPRLGGIAIAVAAVCPLIALFVVDSGVATFVRERADLAVGLLVGGGLMCATGAIDDTVGIRARYKLAVQLLVAALAFAAGYRIDGVSLPFVGPISMGIFSFPVTTLWIVGITNAVNLIDGLDGLAAGVAFFAAFTNFIVAILSGDQTATVFVALLMASLMGSLGGFLFFNFNPARIFMGDSGSYVLGYVLATSSIMAPLQKASTAVSLLVPMVALGIPIFDTLFSLLRRHLERRPIFSPDRGHIHHRLLDMGVTHRRAVVSLYGVSILFAGSAIAIALGSDWEIGAAIFGACVVLIALVRFVGYFEYASKRGPGAGQLYDAVVEELRALVPELIVRLEEAVAESDVARVLQSLGEAGPFTAVALVHPTKGPVFGWSIHKDEEEGVSRQCFAHLAYALREGQGESQTSVRFSLNSDQLLSAPAEILVQLAADRLGATLERIQSDWLVQGSPATESLDETSAARTT